MKIFSTEYLSSFTTNAVQRAPNIYFRHHLGEIVTASGKENLDVDETQGQKPFIERYDYLRKSS